MTVGEDGTIEWKVNLPCSDGWVLPGGTVLLAVYPCETYPNGNTVVCSYDAQGDEARLFEVTRDTKVVWRYSGMERSFHHVQILTTNGQPLTGDSLR